MFWVGTRVQSWNSEAQGQNSGRYAQMSSAHPSVPLLPLCVPLRLHHILLAAVLKKWKPQKVPKPPLSQQALPSLSEPWKPSAPGQPSTVPGVMLSSPCNAGASRGSWTTSPCCHPEKEDRCQTRVTGYDKGLWQRSVGRRDRQRQMGTWNRLLFCCGHCECPMVPTESASPVVE